MYTITEDEHKRLIRLAEAKLKLGVWFAKFAEEHDLSALEAIQILADLIKSISEYAEIVED